MDNVKQLKPSNLDQYQMDNATFDVEKSAWRVSMVDGITLKAESINMPEFKFPEQKVIEVPVIIKEVEIREIPTQIIVKEYERIEIPVIVKEVEYKIVEVPVTVHEVKVIEIEKPVIVTEYKDMPLFLKVCICVQTLGTIGMLITHILKG